METGTRMEVRKVVGIVMVMAMLMGTMSSTEAQSTECVNSLTPCANYLNSTKPPASCCDPLKAAFASQKACLCSIFNNAELLKSLNVTTAQAASLPVHCNITGASPTMCSSSASSAPASSPATNTTTTTTTTPSSGKNGGGVVAWSGVSIGVAVLTRLLFY